MPEWLIWMLAIWFFMRLVGGRRCGIPGHRHVRSGRHGWSLERGGSMRSDARDALPRSRVGTPPMRGQARGAAPRRETAEQRLQRQFVEGRLTIEEYEDRLWRELGPRNGGGR